MYHKYTQTLMLNSDFAAFSTVSIYDAIVASITNQEDSAQGCSTVEYYDDYILTSGGQQFLIPAVMCMVQYVPLKHKKIKFSKDSIYTRDQMTCCYCGTQDITGRTLTYDHVIPRVVWAKQKYEGTPTKWTNIVTACKKCNMNIKRDKTPQEAGMILLKEPIEPNSANYVIRLPPGSIVPKEWLPYLPLLYKHIVRTETEVPNE